MSRIPREIKKKFYLLTPLSLLNIQLHLIFTSCGSSLPVEGISADRFRQHRANIISAALGQKTKGFKATHKLEQEGGRVLLSLLAAATWLLGKLKGRAGKGKREVKVL